MRKTAFIITLILSAASVFAQSVSINNVQFPSDTKWKRLVAETITIIYPEELEEKAVETAAFLDRNFPAIRYSLDTEVRNWTIILNNTLSYTNGYVAAAPRHSQFYSVPPQEGSFTGTADWFSFLAVHEMRHVVQNEKMIRGFTGLAGIFAGEYGWSLLSHIALPTWFWEGDAVLTETLLTTGGRGRNPGFDRGIRTFALNGIKRPFPISTLPSYRYPAPNHYVIGYHLCSYIRKVYGIEAYNSIMETSADFSFVPFISDVAARKATGKSLDRLYRESMEDLEIRWTAQQELLPVTGTERLPAGQNNTYSNYYPLGLFTGKQNLAVLRTSLDSPAQLVEISPDGTEKLLRTIRPIDNNISFNGNLFCWSETRPDPLWGNRSWSDIRLYRPETGEYRLVTSNGRFYSPAISPDGRSIAAVRYDSSMTSSLAVLDAESGEITAEFEADGGFLTQPAWTQDGKGIVFFSQKNWLKSMLMLNPVTGVTETIIKASADEIRSAAPAEDRIYYISTSGGIETLNAVYPGTGENGIAAVRLYGAERPAVSAERVYFADYTPSGYRIASIAPGQAGVLNLLQPEDLPGHVDYFDGLQSQEMTPGFIGSAEYAASAPELQISGQYATEPYSPVQGLVNIHSWGPSTGRDDRDIRLFIRSDDIFNNSDIQLTAGYSFNDNGPSAGISGAYAGFRPIILYGADAVLPLESMSPDIRFHVGAGLPLDFSCGIWNNNFNISPLFYGRRYANGYFTSGILTSASWSLTVQQGYRDLQPPLGFGLSASHEYDFAQNGTNLLTAGIKGYLPSFIENHGLSAGVSWKYSLNAAAETLDTADTPRGFPPAAGSSYNMLIKAGAEYVFPMFYPEWYLGSLIYLPRISGGVFYDTSLVFRGEDLSAINWLQSAGFELKTNFHLLQLQMPLQAGLRLAFNPADGSFRLEDISFRLGFSF